VSMMGTPIYFTSPISVTADIISDFLPMIGFQIAMILRFTFTGTKHPISYQESDNGRERILPPKTASVSSHFNSSMK
jgi:hypothetical protein